MRKNNLKRLLTTLSIVIPTLLIAQPTEEQIKQVEDAKKEVKRMKGQPFPEFQLTALDGTTYSKKELEGKIIMFNFWFSRCTPCVQEMPEINEMVHEFEEEDVVFIAPTFDDEATVSKFLSKRDFEYEIVPDVKDFCLELNVRSYPTHFVVNRNGIIEKVIIGYSAMTAGALKRSVRKLLKSE